MIISLRGTHGSGKSSIVKQLMERYKAEPESVTPKGRPLNYRMSLDNGTSLYVVGSYVTDCGGCDGIQPYSEIWPRVDRLAQLGHVIFEGSLVSVSYGSIGEASEKYGDEMVFAYLNTPLEVCLERIKKRREAKGDTKPVNPLRTTEKFNNTNNSMKRIRDVLHRRTIVLDYRNPIPRLLGLLYTGK